MCGIAGFFNHHKYAKGVIENIIPKSIRSLQERGPDGNGWFCIDEHFKGFNSIDNPSFFERANDQVIKGGFVHTRLSILDLTQSGHQPMSDASKQYWITYNGEIYNFQEIKAELKGLGWEFKSHSDTEVILKSYIQWGSDCLQRFNGMFAFCILDLNKKQLFCARDRIGIKPFYYVAKKDEFLFASDVTTLIATGLYEPEVNWDNIIPGVAFQGALRPNTVYKDVVALEPGYCMEINLHNFTVQKTQYWDLPIGESLNISFNDARDALEEKLNKAISNTLVSDVEVATLMSGGIDSTTMSVMASMIHPNIKAFTLAYDDETNADSELELARLVAQKSSLSHQEHILSLDNVAYDFDDMVNVFEEPVGVLEPHYPMAQYISKQGIKVLLNGLGPDELLAGYMKYNWLDFWSKNKHYRGIRNFIPNIWKLKRLKGLLSADSIFSAYYEMQHNALQSNENPFIAESKQDNFSYMMNLFKCKESDFTDDIQAASYLDLKVYIGTHHNHTTDRFLMRFGIEGRFPFLDHEFVEFCFKLPREYKINNKIGKTILRSLAEKYIHPKCLTAKKKGFGIPEHLFLNKNTQDKIIGRLEKLKTRGFFEEKMINSTCQNLNKNIKFSRSALYLSNFELWYDWFIEKNNPKFTG